MNSKTWIPQEYFNKEVKEWYLSEVKSTFKQATMKSIESLFRKTAPYEFELNKDICNFTTENIYTMMKRFNSASVNSLDKYTKLLGLYVQWCNQHNMVIDAQNHFLEIKEEQLALCTNIIKKQRKVLTRQQILELATRLQAMDAMVLLAFFEGFEGYQFSEIRNLRYRDFNDDGYIYYLETKRKKYSAELKEYARQSMVAGYYSKSNWKGKAKVYPVFSNYDDGCYKITEGSEWDANDFMLRKRIYTQISEIANQLNMPYINMSDIKMSGLFEQLKARAKEHNVDITELITFKKIEDIEMQYDYDDNTLYNVIRKNRRMGVL